MIVCNYGEGGGETGGVVGGARDACELHDGNSESMINDIQDCVVDDAEESHGEEGGGEVVGDLTDMEGDADLQHGWDMASSKGDVSSGDVVTLRFLRKNI